MKKVKIAVLVSGGGTNLQALIDAQGDVLRSGEITLVVSNTRGAYALERAKKAGIATETVNSAQSAVDKEFLSGVTAETTNAEINESDMSEEGKAVAMQKKSQDAINAIRSSIASGNLDVLAGDMAVIESMHATGELDDETYQTIKGEYDAQFTPKTGGRNFNASVSELSSKGNNFKVTYNDTNYRVESAGESTDPHVLKAASGVENNGMFGYRNKIYIKKDGKVYEIQKRQTNWGGTNNDWNELYKSFFG